MSRTGKIARLPQLVRDELNLSDWRLGGHRDWLRHQETRDLVRSLAEQDEELRDEGDGVEVGDRLAGVLAAELVRTAQALMDTVADPVERWPRLRELLQELAQLRRDDHRAARLRMDREEAERLQTERDDKAEADWFYRQKAKVIAPVQAQLLVKPFADAMGGSATAWEAAKLAMELKFDLPIGSLGPKSKPAATSAPVKPSQGGSSLGRKAGP